jgi:hypothetical protein
MPSELELKSEDLLLLIIDVQEKLAPAMEPGLYGTMLKNLGRLLSARSVLPFQVLVSEQYPQGLGPTVPALREVLGPVTPRPKTSFSVLGEPALAQAIEESGKKTILVAGMEAHICVYQSVRALTATHRVHLLSDGIASRTVENFGIGKGLAERAGAILTSTETVLFDLLGGAGTDAFRTVSKLVKS